MSIKDKINSILSSDVNRRMFTHSFWILLGNVISKFVLLIATILMARYLGKEEYGQFGIIKSTILMFAVFAGMELGMTATKYISQYKSTDKQKVERIIGISNLFSIVISLLISAGVYLFSSEIAKQINAPHLSLEIKISSFILFFSSLNGIQNGILAGIEKFKNLSFNNAIAGVISSVGLILASNFFSLAIVVLAFGLNYVLVFLLNYISLKKQFYSEFKVKILNKDNFNEIDVLWKFSLPAILAGLMIGPVTWFCNYLLVNQPNGYNEMANFDIASQWRNTILFIPAALSQIALPLLASNLNDKEAYKLVFNKNLKINLIIGFSLVIVFVLASPLITFIYGEKYQDALFPMILMFITTGFITINNVIGQAIASQGKMWLGFYVNLIWAILLTLLAYIFIVVYNWGAIGLCGAYLISYMAHSLIQFLYIKRYI
ncbi:oligosaccharide flippase family protein [Sphingobacterium sp. BN32]|uniref:oligosaccharide flippase family protein n=1 Tax=Sphingobacterium sp. BN32 TaxID=3058432 RepID=UPI00265D5AA9|nr:oligosaccharide flippase family protein [Sphingobacterium sp. BN32]WKK58409.1 oligosaccharide flippase family protein [Sphingobacterium sp. BN32]